MLVMTSIPGLYLDTSVLGGYHDAEFRDATRALWQAREAGLYQFFSSVVVAEEAGRAPLAVRQLMEATFGTEKMLPMTTEARELARRYVAHRVVSPNYSADALHVAVCTLARIDYLVSWNFRHLSNPRREAGFNTVNVLQGYPAIRIVTPTQLLHVHDQEQAP